MPQESLRSVVYRSFVTCDDPRGVVEGKTIRISKSDSTKMGSRRIDHEAKKNSKEKERMSSSCKKATNPSSYQLVEVKNGAQKLNEVIDSWSKGIGFEGQSKDIAKDLLKGALDLQESLLMLGRVHEASEYMAKFKKKHQKKTSDDLVNTIGSNRFENCRNYDMGFREERNLAHGSPVDCYEELRNVIKNGLERQNLLQKERVSSSGKRKQQLSPDIASTSSSRSSSMVYSSHEFTSSESFSSRVMEEKPKGSNLIGKLMGLDEYPSKPLPRKQLDSGGTRPVDIDLPNMKKPQFVVRKLDREQMTLDSIIEQMQSKGFLRSNKHQIEQIFKDDVPPIVLMKPHDRKVKSGSNSIRKLHQERAKAEEKEKSVKNKMKSPSNNQKTAVPVITKQETEKKIDKIQKMAPPVRRKPENLKPTNSVSKTVSSKQAKPTSKRISTSNLSTSKSSNQKKNLKIEKPTNIHEVLKEETEDSEVMIKEIDNGRRQEDSYRISDDLTVTNRSEMNNDHEENGGFDTIEGKARILKNVGTFQDSDSAEFDLFLDCVNEFLDQENSRKIPTVHPLFQSSILTSRFCVSEDHLMQEITNRVENLSNYSKISNGDCNADTIYGLLERDLYSGTTGGAWGTSWKDGCTLDGVEEVVLDLEKMVLSRFIDDMVMELVLY